MIRDLIAGVIVLALVFGGGYWYGKHVESEAQALEVERLNAESLKREQALTTAVHTTANVLRAQNEKTNQAIRERNRAIDDGSYRLRLKASCSVPTPTNTPIATGDSGGETRAELDAEVGKTLFAIAEEGDRAIRKLNSCIDAYNAVYQTLMNKK